MTRDEITQDEIKEILLASQNIILHGAPGTGKTYLAKEIAKSLCGVSDIKELEKSGRFKMVQFHPSYDYTDFVEGLRPEDDGKGNIVFKRKDGAFKQFCKRAITTSRRVRTNGNSLVTPNFKGAWDSLWGDIDSGSIKYLRNKKRGFTHQLIANKNDRNRINFTTKLESISNSHWATFDGIMAIHNHFGSPDSIGKVDDIRKVCKGTQTSTLWAIYNEVYNRAMATLNAGSSHNKEEALSESDQQFFLFLIDEINRGDLSKIFGELFYAIDPGYPGEEGKIDTQYQNLIPKDGDNDFNPDKADPFRDGFYIPENVYIIGTMNDIDRSVESMDFAMRRRFQFIEVTAEMSARNMEIPEDIKRRMENLNRSIVEDMKLSTSFQIGASYFLKLKDGKESTDELWRYRLEGLLREYLRGEDDIDVKIKRLEEAYNKPADNNSAHETNNVI